MALYLLICTCNKSLYVLIKVYAGDTILMLYVFILCWSSQYFWFQVFQMSCLRHITSRLRTVLRSSNGLLHPRPCYLLDPSRHCASSPNTDHILVDDKRGDLVYVGTAARLVKGVKIFSLTSSGLCLGLQGVGLKLGVLTKVSAAVKWTMLGSIRCV